MFGTAVHARLSEGVDEAVEVLTLRTAPNWEVEVIEPIPVGFVEMPEKVGLFLLFCPHKAIIPFGRADACLNAFR